MLSWSYENQHTPGLTVSDEKLLEFDYDNIIYANKYVTAQVHFLFSDIALGTFRKTIFALPNKKFKVAEMRNGIKYTTNRQLTVRMGGCIENIPIDEIFQMILICSSKIRLLLGLNMDGLRRKFALSSEYHEGLTKLTKEGYKDWDDANPVAAVFKTCKKEHLAQPTAFLMMMSLPPRANSPTQNTWGRTNRWAIIDLFE